MIVFKKRVVLSALEYRVIEYANVNCTFAKSFEVGERKRKY